ncbi:dienelactone hydrolase [Caulobacter ginsengisoli]|uniref:Dienelactone hydrolase n=1 Tax=Caulobacter ginsengisoli TaxID=400775 RepID=A0ABU0IT98_9CAUL|nr:dienelactone hydrolase family protein [Caulobacter ginsengisoli]MDQ0465220.1 dienelactone hydrolase [Caulobacter ginsengisoli]
MADIDALAGYDRFKFTHDGRTREVFRKGSGPAVIIMHEIPGLHPQVVDYADRVAAAGMSVYLPSLFGAPGRKVTIPYALGEMFMNICIRREFHVWAGQGSSPIVDWLRALARKAHAECGGPGVGALGMCFTGGFALAMMTEPAVVAPVLSQPSLPLGKKGKASIDSSPAEIACAKRRFEDEDLSLLGLRFKGDDFVPDERFAFLKETFGDRFEDITLAAEDGAPGTGRPPHSVLTIHLRNSGPTKDAEARTVSFFRERLGLA